MGRVCPVSSISVHTDILKCLYFVLLRNFRIFYECDYSIRCSAFRLDHGRHSRETALQTYSAENTEPLLSWVQQIIEKALSLH